MINPKKSWHIIAFLFLCCLCGSCKKDSSTPAPSPVLSFKADGVVYSYTGDWNRISLTGCSVDPLFINALGYFILTGVRTSNSDGFEARVTAPLVEAKTYSIVEFECFIGGIHYLESSAAVVTISKITNGRASGSFSGKVATAPGAAEVNITEGSFTDVLIR